MGERGGRPDNGGDFQGVWAIRDAVPTRRHAEMLFEMVVDALGDRAWIETWNSGGIRTLYRRESAGSALLVPWPVLSVARGGREGPAPIATAIPGVYEEPPVRPGPAPRLRDLGPGQLDVHDGPHRATVSYGSDGMWFECSRSASPEALSGVVAALEAKSAAPVEMVAAYVAGLDHGRHGPGRVFLPVPLHNGARGAWLCGLGAVREALFAAKDASAPGYLAADGYTGCALARGETREAALDALRAEVARLRPFPEVPSAPAGPLPEPLEESTVTEDGFLYRATFRGPSSDQPRVKPTVENTPAAVLPVEGPPGAAPPFGAWTRLVGAHGTVVPAAIRWEPEGFTLIGDRLLDHLDIADLEARLAAADFDAPERHAWAAQPGFESPITDTRVRTYRLADDDTGALLDRPAVSTFWGSGFHARTLDGDQLRWSAVRMRAEEA